MKYFLTLSLSLIVASRTHAETPLESAVLTAVRDAHFENVIDFGAGNQEHPVNAHLGLPAKKIAQPPNVDVAVIELDAAGNMVDRADVLLSRDYPNGLVVSLEKDGGASGVRFLRWDIERSDGGTFSPEDNHLVTPKGWTNNPPLTEKDDLVTGCDGAAIQFMTPYPASLFKLMVVFHIMRMVDAGKISLDGDYTYAIATAKPETRKIRDWIDPMVTLSDNHCTSALVKMCHDMNEIEGLNREFRELNLGTLQINGTNPKTGTGWNPGQIHMTSFDVARLLWLIDGAPGTLWLAADKKPVTAQYLSDSSRAYLKKELSDQAFNVTLSSADFTGGTNVRAGIPSRVSPRWINSTNGHVFLERIDYGMDIREANTNAEVNFAHKTGWTFNYASDAGIVTSLPGKPIRHYIIAFMGNLGYRYADEIFADRKTFPYEDHFGPIEFTQRIPAMGKAIDDAVVRLSASPK